MADSEVSELVERLKARDERIAILDMALQIRAELESSPIINAVLGQAKREADAALEGLARADPGNVEEIIKLQAIVYRARFIGATINTLLERGRQAEMSLRDDSEIAETD